MSEHAVVVYLQLCDEDFGTEDEREEIHALSDELAEAIESHGAGEFDGDEFGGGECTLYMYGPDADRLFEAIEPVLRASPFTKGGHAVKRCGAATDADAREVRVELE